MDNNQLNLLVKKITQMKEQLRRAENNPLLVETLTMYLYHLNEKYGIYLNEMLFEIYDEYCADGNMESIENYLDPEGVPIEITDEPGETFCLKLKPFPLRFVLEKGSISRSLKVA